MTLTNPQRPGHLRPRQRPSPIPAASVPIDSLEDYSIWRYTHHSPDYAIPLSSYFAVPLGANPYITTANASTLGKDNGGGFRLHISPFASDPYDREFVRQIIIAGFPIPEELGHPEADYLRPAHLNFESDQMRSRRALTEVKRLLEDPPAIDEDGEIAEDDPSLYLDDEGNWIDTETGNLVPTEPLSGFDFLSHYGAIHRFLVSANDPDECLGALIHVRMFGALVIIDTENNLMWTTSTIDSPVSFRDEIELGRTVLELWDCR